MKFKNQLPFNMLKIEVFTSTMTVCTTLREIIMARPKGLRRGRHRMTPARRAALRKAQRASARKRQRKQIASNVKRGAIAIGGAFAAARVSSYIVKPSKARNDYYYIKGMITRSKKTQEPQVSKTLKQAKMTWIS